MPHDKQLPAPTLQKRERARQFRREPTPTEAILWEALRDRKCGGLKFRRQVPIPPYIADFLSVTAHLIIEFDGSAHDERDDYDTTRTHFLTLHGYRVLRFSNDRVTTDLPGLLLEIIAASGGG